MEDAREIYRYGYLFSQFPFEDNRISFKERKSIRRVLTYINKNTGIQHLCFVKEDVLISYISHHKEQGFEQQSFSQTISDVRCFISFLEDYTQIVRVPRIDLSLRNSMFWLNL